MSDYEPVLYSLVGAEQYTKQMVWLMETTEHINSKGNISNGWKWDDPKNLISKKVRDFIKDNEKLNDWFIKKHGISLTNYNYDTDVDDNEMRMLIDIYMIMYGSNKASIEYPTSQSNTSRKHQSGSVPHHT